VAPLSVLDPFGSPPLGALPNAEVTSAAVSSVHGFGWAAAVAAISIATMIAAATFLTMMILQLLK